MSANERNATYEMARIFQELSTPSQITRHKPNKNSTIDNLPNVKCDPKVSGLYTDQTLEEPENPYATFYNIDDFTGYCGTPCFVPPTLVDYSAAYPLNDHLNSSFDSYSHVPNGQAIKSGHELHDQQYHHQVQPHATFSAFRNNSEPSTCSGAQPQLTQQASHPPFMEEIDYSVP